MQAYASRLKRIEYFCGLTHRTNFEDMSMDQFLALTILSSCLHVNKYPHHTNHCHRPLDQDLSERTITELDWEDEKQLCWLAHLISVYNKRLISPQYCRVCFLPWIRLRYSSTISVHSCIHQHDRMSLHLNLSVTRLCQCVRKPVN